MEDLRRSDPSERLPMSTEDPPRVDDAGDLVEDVAEDTDTDIGLALHGCDDDESLKYSMSLIVGLLLCSSARGRWQSERAPGGD